MKSAPALVESNSIQQFHLLAERLCDNVPPATDEFDDAGGNNAIRVPIDNLAYLSAYRDERPDVSTEAPSPLDGVLVVEAIRRDKHPYLTLVQPAAGNRVVRLNGCVASPVSILQVGDEIQLGDDWLLYVSLFCKPYIGPAGQDRIGQTCAVCRIPFAAEDRVYVCPNCDSAIHFMDESDNEGDRLQCVLNSTRCPVCQDQIRMTEGLTYVPAEY